MDFLVQKRVESRNFASSRVESAKKGLDSSRVESSQDSYPSLVATKALYPDLEVELQD